jgi:hypothetical protein
MLIPDGQLIKNGLALLNKPVWVWLAELSKTKAAPVIGKGKIGPRSRVIGKILKMD